MNRRAARHLVILHGRAAGVMVGLVVLTMAVIHWLSRPFLVEHALPPVSLATFWVIVPFTVTLAGVGLVESLMTMTLVDENVSEDPQYHVATDRTG